MSKFSVSFVVPSKGRPEIAGGALSLFVDPLLSVADSEADAYLEHNPDARLLVHPDDVVGLTAKRNWILRNVDSDAVFMVDDDVAGFYCVVGNHYREIADPAEISAVVWTTAMCARDAGTACFGFAHTPDVRHARSFKPLSLCAWVNGMSIGVVGRDVWFDEELVVHDDIDFTLSTLLKKRFVWRDNRFAFKAGGFFTIKGGQSSRRTLETIKASQDRLRRKWGNAVHIDHFKKQEAGHRNSVSIRVNRSRTN